MPHYRESKSKLEIPKSKANVTSMTVELLLEKSIRFDRSGKPLEVIIPYEEFIDFIEEHGLSPRRPNAETLEAMNEPIEDLPHYHTAKEAIAALGI